MRGMKQVFRDKVYTFNYQKNFRCFNDQDYFNKSDAVNWKNKIQDIILYQFQPYQQSQLGTLLKKMVDQAKTEEGKAALKTQLEKTIKGAVFGAKVVKNNFIQTISKNPSGYYSKLSQNWYNQVTQINNFFRVGYWLNTYTIPGIDLENNMFYLAQTPNQNWKYDGSKTENKKDQLAGALDSLMNPIASVQNTILKTPAWLPNPGTQDYKVTTTFDLINDLGGNVDETSWTFRNFAFLQNFFAGTLPVSMPTQIMQSPNIYRVDIPGKCIFYWAYISIKVECKGKQKVLPILNQYLNTKMDNKAITSNTLWPQAWTVTVDITNLTPFSFTTYMNYLMAGPKLLEGRVDTHYTKLANQNAMLGTQNIANVLIQKIFK